jgi:uncharacterized protein GlcG (DUF336 family)
MMWNLKSAGTAIAAAREFGAQNGLKPLAVVALDAGGYVIATAREDGASNGRADIASGKATGALEFGMGSGSLMTRAEQQSYFVVTAAAAVWTGVVPVPGGVLVGDGERRVLGALGISGDTSDNDEAAAIQGVKATGLTPNAGA